MPVHDIDMDHIRAGFGRFRHLFAETGKIRRQKWTGQS